MRRFVLAATALGLLGLVEACGGTRGTSGPPSFGISGTVSGATRVAVDLTGAASASTTTDANGGYSFSSLANGSYVVTPSKSGYTFLPASIVVAIAGADAAGQNFTASAAATVHGIYGTVSGLVAAGVGISFGGAATASTTTDALGNYSFTGLADGDYVVTPSASGYTFLPASIVVAIAGADVTGQDFISASTGGSCEPWGLWVMIFGDGGGTVTGPGISCSKPRCPSSPTCSWSGACGFTYEWGAQVALTATPANDGSTFAGWGGACSGTGECQVTLEGYCIPGALYDVWVTASFNP